MQRKKAKQWLRQSLKRVESGRYIKGKSIKKMSKSITRLKENDDE